MAGPGEYRRAPARDACPLRPTQDPRGRLAAPSAPTLTAPTPCLARRFATGRQTCAPTPAPCAPRAGKPRGGKSQFGLARQFHVAYAERSCSAHYMSAAWRAAVPPRTRTARRKRQKRPHNYKIGPIHHRKRWPGACIVHRRANREAGPGPTKGRQQGATMSYQYQEGVARVLPG